MFLGLPRVNACMVSFCEVIYIHHWRVSILILSLFEKFRFKIFLERMVLFCFFIFFRRFSGVFVFVFWFLKGIMGYASACFHLNF
jgi:hypothetical protein